jgi:DHA2 family multidrug resistance protein
MAFWGLGIVVAPMLGPVLGGWITDNYSWRWIFYINLPIGIAALAMSKIFIFDPGYITRKTERVDYWGMGMLAVGIGALQVLLDKGQQEDWFSSHFITWLAVITVVGLVAFVIRELVSEHPVVDLRVFKVRTYATGVFMMTVLGYVLYGSTVLLPIFLQVLLGYPSLQAGLAMLPRGLGSFIAMPFVGILMSKIEARKLLFVGFLVAAFAMWDLGRINLSAGYWDIFWPQFIQGISMGFLFVPLTTITHSVISKERMGNATSIFNLMRNIGGSVGIAMVTTMVARDTQRNVNILGAHVSTSNPAAQQMFTSIRAGLMARGADFVTATQQAYAAIFGTVAKQANMVAFVGAFRLLGIMFLMVVPLILLMKKAKGGGPAPMH